MELSELKQTSPAELTRLLQEQRSMFRDLQFQAHEGQLKQLHKLADTKKTIARILTLLNAAKAEQS